MAEALREAGPKVCYHLVHKLYRGMMFIIIHYRVLMSMRLLAQVDPSKLGRRLYGAYVEHAPDNNRISSCLDTGKSVKTLLERSVVPSLASLEISADPKAILSPENKHVGTLGIAAAVGHWLAVFFGSACCDADGLHSTDEAMKAAAYLQEALLHPKIAKSQEPNETAFNLAFNTNLPIFEWFEQKGNEHRLLRFGVTTVTTENNAIG